MKNIIYVLLTTLCTASLVAIEGQKKPARVDSVAGDVPNEYAIVRTTINKDPLQDDDNKPIISRAEIARVRPGILRTEAVKTELKVPPTKEIDFKDVGRYTNAVAEIAGAIDPKAGAATTIVSTLIDEGLRIASEELNKFYGNDKTTITLLEILPARYYRINGGSVEVTPAFKTDLKEFQDLVDKYMPVARKFNEVNRKYTMAYNKAAGPMGIAEAKQKDLLDMWNTQVVPLLKDKVRLESSFQKYPMQRVALMAVMSPEETGCQEVGRVGPWKLYLYYYVGAKQTNVLEIPFCAKSRDEIQDFSVTLLPNRVVKLNFQPGGVKFGATSNNTISFPVVGPIKMNYLSPESHIYNWFDEMVIDEKADSIETYMFPFDVYKILAKREAEYKKKADKALKAKIQRITAAITTLKTPPALKELATSIMGAIGVQLGETPEPEETKPETPAEEAMEKPVEVPEEKPTEGPEEGPSTEEPGEKPTEKPAEKPAATVPPAEKTLIQKGQEAVGRIVPAVTKHGPTVVEAVKDVIGAIK